MTDRQTDGRTAKLNASHNIVMQRRSLSTFGPSPNLFDVSVYVPIDAIKCWLDAILRTHSKSKI